jgi:hypothetical protein
MEFGFLLLHHHGEKNCSAAKEVFVFLVGENIFIARPKKNDGDDYLKD